MNFITLVNRILPIFTMFAIASVAYPMAGWDYQNQPELMAHNFNKTFKELPLSGTLSRFPWSDHYWPTYKGGISYRWNMKSTEEEKRYGYKIRNAKQIKPTMKTEELSAAEKYDLYIGQYDFPLTQYERERTGVLATIPGHSSYNPDFKIPIWEGLCHAWAPATMLFENPKPVTVTNADGIIIKFGSSDIKALLTYFLHITPSETRSLGSRCELAFSELADKVSKGEMTQEEFDSMMNSPECADTNAGAFHVAIVNQIALRDEGFVVDITRDAEVWNQPVLGFTSKIINEKEGASIGAAVGTVKEVEVETEMLFIAEVDQTFDQVKDHSGVKTQTYRYRLELNKLGRIIGGEWLTTDRPDFIWKRTLPNFDPNSFFGPLEELYYRSIM